MRSPSFGLRVLLAATVPAVLIACILVWYFTQSRLSDLETELRNRGTAIARQLAPSAEFGIFSGNRDILQQLVDSAMREADVIGAAVLERNGLVLASSGRLVQPALPRVVPVEASVVSEEGGLLVFAAPVGPLRAAAEDLFTQNLPGSAGTGMPVGTVLIMLSRGDMEQRKNELIVSAIALTALGLLLAALIARMLAVQVTGPVQRLAEVVSDLKEGNLQARASGGESGVLRQLEAGINEMANALEESQRTLERRVAEATHELQEQKQRAEEANRAKTQFLAAASHDLRQPLQAAGLFVGSLRLRNKDPDVAGLIERVERALGSLEGVLEALLDISRLDAGVVAPRIERFPIANVLRRLQDTFAEPASQLSVELRIRPSPSWCESDPLILERILANLLSNALRYCDKGRVLVGCRLRGGALSIEVRDNGPGIEEDRHREIFREFVRLENAERLRDKGLGLGLAIVDRLTRLLNHRIYVQSRKGAGATFGIVVPRVAAEARSEQPPAQPLRVDLAGKRILVLEDDEEVLAALGLLLSQHGAVPLLARSVAHALSLADSKPDLVISDDRLGLGDHRIPAIRLLRARFATGVPRIILAGETILSTSGETSQAGFAVIRKPAGSGELLQAIAAALRAS